MEEKEEEKYHFDIDDEDITEEDIKGIGITKCMIFLSHLGDLLLCVGVPHPSTYSSSQKL